eukprot:g34352.t1
MRGMDRHGRVGPKCLFPCCPNNRRIDPLTINSSDALELKTEELKLWNLLHSYNAGIYPAVGKMAQEFPGPAVKQDKSNPASYHAISLLSLQLHGGLALLTHGARDTGLTPSVWTLYTLPLAT